MAHRKTLVLDFDGVLHAYTSGWKGADVVADGPVPGAMAFLVEAAERFDVAVVSSRSHAPGGREAMVTAIVGWLDRVQQPAHSEGYRTTVVLTDGGVETARIRFPLHKPAAFLTIDDRAMTFTGRWPTIDELQAFVPWNKHGADALKGGANVPDPGHLPATEALYDLASVEHHVRRIRTAESAGQVRQEARWAIEHLRRIAGADVPDSGRAALLAEAAELPDPARSLLSHNERELIGLCRRLAEALRDA